jgi:hypothetical protein
MCQGNFRNLQVQISQLWIRLRGQCAMNSPPATQAQRVWMEFILEDSKDM